MTLCHKDFIELKTLCLRRQGSGHFRSTSKYSNFFFFLELALEKVRLVMWKNQICSTFYPPRPNKNKLLLYLGISEVSPSSQWLGVNEGSKYLGFHLFFFFFSFLKRHFQVEKSGAACFLAITIRTQK